MTDIMHFSRTPPVAARRRQAGLTLVELMISMAIGLILVAGIATLIARQSSSRAELEKTNRQIENGRYALTLLQEDIQHAGFYGQYIGALPALAALPDPCSTSAADIDAALAMLLQGYDAPASVPAPLSTCLPDANHIPGTDILVIRRLEATDALPTIATLVAGQIYVQTTPSDKVTALGPDPTPATPSVYTLKQKDATTPAQLRRFVEHIYFLSPCNVYASGATACTSAADNGRPIPTLKRLEMSVTAGATALITVPLVEGIENLQLDYGIDATGDGTPATPYITAPTIANWPNVMSVQVTLLARNTEPSSGHDDGTKIYNMGAGGTVGPFSASPYKRHVYSANVRVVNPSGQRE